MPCFKDFSIVAKHAHQGLFPSRTGGVKGRGRKKSEKKRSVEATIRTGNKATAPTVGAVAKITKAISTMGSEATLDPPDLPPRDVKHLSSL